MSGLSLKDRLFRRGAALKEMERATHDKVVSIDTKVNKRIFQAAKVNRFTADWQTPSRPLNEDLRYSLFILRNRSRDLELNSEFARRYLQLVETHVVGSEGFNLTVQGANASGAQDTRNNSKIEAAFDLWSKRGTADITGRYSLTEILRICARTTARDGECLIRIHDDLPPTKDNPFGFALEMVDASRIDTFRHFDDKAGTRVRLGVELDGNNRPQAYYIITGSEPYSYPGSNPAERMPARQFFHCYIAERPEQWRGVPWMSAILDLIHMLGEYQDAAVVAARVGAAKMGFFKTPDGNLSPLATDDDPTAGLITDVEPGHFSALPPGYEFQAFTPDYPHQLYPDFTNAILRSIASGLGVSYHALTGDLTSVNFSSIRSGTLEERESWMVKQDWMITSILEPLYRRWLDRALKLEAIKGLPSIPPDLLYQRFSAHSWRGRRWPWVDPLKDIEATLAAVNAGLKSPQQAAADAGIDIEATLNDIARFNEMSKAAGLGLTYGQNPTPAMPPIPPGDPNGKTPNQ